MRFACASRFLASPKSATSKPVTWESILSTETINPISRLPADGVPIFLPDAS
jgi:hypothetical protein